MGSGRHIICCRPKKAPERALRMRATIDGNDGLYQGLKVSRAEAFGSGSEVSEDLGDSDEPDSDQEEDTNGNLSAEEQLNTENEASVPG